MERAGGSPVLVLVVLHEQRCSRREGASFPSCDRAHHSGILGEQGRRDRGAIDGCDETSLGVVYIPELYRRNRQGLLCDHAPHAPLPGGWLHWSEASHAGCRTQQATRVFGVASSCGPKAEVGLHVDAARFAEDSQENHADAQRRPFLFQGKALDEVYRPQARGVAQRERLFCTGTQEHWKALGQLHRERSSHGGAGQLHEGLCATDSKQPPPCRHQHCVVGLAVAAQAHLL
mmetsp:Transcript_95337/g.199430  ORF Transcript_95337/g.199430 Transcript_95337/m.199430 type:complete len:232 (-) Transcript_95337:779-1474(-)